MGLFDNSTGIAIWDTEAMANQANLGDLKGWEHYRGEEEAGRGCSEENSIDRK